LRLLLSARAQIYNVRTGETNYGVSVATPADARGATTPASAGQRRFSTACCSCNQE